MKTGINSSKAFIIEHHCRMSRISRMFLGSVLSTLCWLHAGPCQFAVEFPTAPGRDNAEWPRKAWNMDQDVMRKLWDHGAGPSNRAPRIPGWKVMEKISLANKVWRMKSEGSHVKVIVHILLLLLSLLSPWLYLCPMGLHIFSLIMIITRRQCIWALTTLHKQSFKTFPCDQGRDLNHSKAFY